LLALSFAAPASAASLDADQIAAIDKAGGRMIVSFLIGALMASAVAKLGVRPDDQDPRLWRQHHDRFRALTCRDIPADEPTATFVVDNGASVVALPKHMVDKPVKSGPNAAMCTAARFF
jgi:hypothetical protein